VRNALQLFLNTLPHLSTPLLLLFFSPLSVGSSVGEVAPVPFGGKRFAALVRRMGWSPQIKVRIFIKKSIQGFFLRKKFLYERESEVDFAFNNEEPNRSWL